MRFFGDMYPWVRLEEIIKTLLAKAKISVYVLSPVWQIQPHKAIMRIQDGGICSKVGRRTCGAEINFIRPSQATHPNKAEH